MFGKSKDKIWVLGQAAPKVNLRGSEKPIVEGVGLKMQPAGKRVAPFGELG